MYCEDRVLVKRYCHATGRSGRKLAVWSVSGEDKKIRVYPTADIASLAVYGVKTG